MFPDLITVDKLDQSKLQTGHGFVVGPLATPPDNSNYLNRGVLVGKFEGLNSLFEFQRSLQATAKRDKSSDRVGGGYNYFRTYEAAVDTYLHNPMAITDYQELDDQINGGEASGKELEWDVTGDFIDIGRFLEGEPECYGHLTDGNPRNRRVSIIVNTNFSANVDKTMVNHRSARILRMVDWLESQGIRTSVTAIESTECSHVEVIVKRFDEPLVLTDIGVVTHSDFLRRIVLRFVEYSATFSSGYGQPRYFDQGYNHKDWESDYNGEYAIYAGEVKDYYDHGTIDAAYDLAESDMTKILAEDDTDRKVLKVL